MLARRATHGKGNGNEVTLNSGRLDGYRYRCRYPHQMFAHCGMGMATCSAMPPDFDRCLRDQRVLVALYNDFTALLELLRTMLTDLEEYQGAEDQPQNRDQMESPDDFGVDRGR